MTRGKDFFFILESALCIWGAVWTFSYIESQKRMLSA